MKIRAASVVLGLCCAVFAFGEGLSARIDENGVVSYLSAAGRRVDLTVGFRCSDLWVAPDESAIAFIADLGRKAGAVDIAPDELPLRTEVFVALRRDGFTPVNLTPSMPVLIDGRSWEVFRHPRLTPDLNTVLFGVPYTLTTSQIIRETFGQAARVVGDATDFCVVWGGSASGDLLIQNRQLDPNPRAGVEYRCYVWQSLAHATGVGEDCEDFFEFSQRWAGARGGVCR